MIVDAQNLYSDAQAFSTDAASTNLIDHGAARQLGSGEPLGLAILVDVAADATTGDETYEFQWETDDNADFSSATDLITQAIAAASLTAGSLHVIPIPPGAAVERYTRVYFNGGGTTPTITATIWLAPLSAVAGRAKIYPDGFTIS